jgi:hypothetical protein
MKTLRFYLLVVKWAWREATKGQRQQFYTMIVGGILSIAGLYLYAGGTEAMKELGYLALTVAGVLGAILLLFASNLVLAPAQLFYKELEARVQSEAGRRAKLQLFIEQSRGEELITRGSTSETMGGGRYTTITGFETEALSLVCKNIGGTRSGACVAKLISAEKISGDGAGSLGLIEPIKLSWSSVHPEQHLEAVLEPNEVRRIWIAAVRGDGHIWLLRDPKQLPVNYHRLLGSAGTYHMVLQVSDGGSDPIQMLLEVTATEGAPVKQGIRRGNASIAMLKQGTPSL